MSNTIQAYYQSTRDTCYERVNTLFPFLKPWMSMSNQYSPKIDKTHIVKGYATYPFTYFFYPHRSTLDHF